MKRYLGKAAVLFGIFILVLGVYGFTVYKDNVRISEKESKLMGTSTLPVVHNVIDGYAINELHGYTMDMDRAFMREIVTPVAEDGMVEFDVTPYQCNIIGMEYEVYDYQTQKILANEKIENWEKKKNNLKAKVSMSGLKADKEYALKLILTTEEQTKIQYDSLLKREDNQNIEKVLAFTKEYSKSTLDYEKAANFVIPYIEPKADNPNTNLGNVDITSSLRQLTYQGLDVSRVTEPSVSISEMTKEATCVVMKYRVKAKNEYDTEEEYQIAEYYRVAIHNGGTYLTSYHRTMDQRYNPDTANTNTKKMNLGIDSDLQVDYLTSESNNYIAFVNNQNLYMMDIHDNEVTEAFTFEADETDGIRENYDQHGIKIISVSDTGDIDFLVYGYMNRGEHEGKSGVTLYHYNKSQNIVEEKIYIPSTKPYEVLKEVIGKLCYISKRQIMYLYMDNSIYSVDLAGKEYVEVVGNLKKQDFAISSDGKNIAWIQNDTIRILNLDDGSEGSVPASKGKRLVPLGFIGEDIVYGTASQKNVYLDRYGDETILMDNVKIVNTKEMKTSKTYQKKGSYIVDVAVSDAMLDITLCKKVSKSVNGIGYKVTGHDQVLNNIETKQAAVTTGTLVTDLKQTQMVIFYASNVISEDATKLVKPEEIRTDAGNALSIKNEDREDQNYYVYAEQSLLGIYSSQAKAKDLAVEKKGVVTDGKGIRIYGYEEKFNR